MKKLKIRLMKRKLIQKIFFIYFSVCSLGIFLAFIKENILLGSIISFIFLLLAYIMYTCIDCYGIRINKKSIVFKTFYKRKRYLCADIKKIEVWLVKLGAYYTVKVKVNLNKNYKKAEFNWNEMYLHGLGLLVTNINDNNINYYIELFSKNELFYVYPIKK